MQIICCIYKLFVRPLKAFLPPPLIHVRVKLQIHFAQKLCGALAQDSRILGFDHLKWTFDGTFERALAREGIWTIVFKKSQMLALIGGGGGRVKLRFDWYIGGCIFGCFREFQSKAVDWIALKSSFTLQGKSKALPWTAASCKNLSFIAFLRTVLEQLRNA